MDRCERAAAAAAAQGAAEAALLQARLCELEAALGERQAETNAEGRLWEREAILAAQTGERESAKAEAARVRDEAGRAWREEGIEIVKAAAQVCIFLVIEFGARDHMSF